MCAGVFAKYICLVFISGALRLPEKYAEGGENIGKSSYLNLPDIGFTLFTPIKGRIDSLTVYIYDQGE
jgi:hypothetical protein